MGIPRFALGLFAACVLAGCDLFTGQERGGSRSVTNEGLDALIRGVKDNMIFVEGGEYLMDDYGSQNGPKRLPYDLDTDSKSLHRVQLSSCSMYSRLNQSSAEKFAAETRQSKCCIGWKVTISGSIQRLISAATRSKYLSIGKTPENITLICPSCLNLRIEAYRAFL